jgi:outer membrane receptor protein involved in Fe transport
MLRSVFILFLSIIAHQSIAQGSIAGKVTDLKTGEGIIGANVIIQGTTIGAPTDVDGNFLIENVNEGTYVLQVSYVAYKTHTIPNVQVKTARRTVVEIKLTEDNSQLEEVVVTATMHTATDYSLLRSIKDASLIVTGISAEQISRSLDRDAAQVLRRVPGITIKDNQFVQIRGLSERYNAVMLHNAYAPSVETDVRSFTFANIPSAQIERMLVFKSPSADLPGDFAGGVVKVFTKSIPDENNIIIDYSTQVRLGTTFKSFSHQQYNANYLLPYNSGYYDLPAAFPADLTQVDSDSKLVQAGRSLKNLWTPVKGAAIPDQRFTLTLNRKFNIGSVQVGNISAISYSNSYATYDVTRGDFTESGGKVDQNFGYSDKQYNQVVRSGLLFNWAFRFNQKNMVEFKNLFNLSSTDQYVSRMGTGISTGQRNGSFDKQYRGIYSGQLLGNHELFSGSTSLDWVFSYNTSYRDQPDYKRYRSNYDDATGLASIIIPNTADPNFLGRFYSKLNEHAFSGGFSVKQRFPVAEGKDPLKSPEVKAGMFFENKSRDFSARNIGYQLASIYLNPSLINAPLSTLFESQNINNSDGIMVGEISYRKNSYQASNNLLAFYTLATVPFGNFKLDAGVRFENNLQQLSSFDDFADKPVNPKYQINKALPSANLSYNFSDKSLIRAAYGKTLNRPEFRELAPFSFYDFNFNFLYVGNPGLKVATIQNIDIRYEFYPSKGEMINLGGFYKNFKNPIETVVDINSPGGGVKNVNFANATSAYSFGVELEIKKSLAGITSSRILNNMSAMLNTAVIRSRINIPKAIAAGQETNRALQGQAPYVINAGLFYDLDDQGIQINTLFNMVGKNIAFVGNENFRTVYLMPRKLLDLNLTKKVGERFQLKFGISDLLNQPMLFIQDSGGIRIIQKFKPGQVFSAGLTVRL